MMCVSMPRREAGSPGAALCDSLCVTGGDSGVFLEAAIPLGPLRFLSLPLSEEKKKLSLSPPHTV